MLCLQETKCPDELFPFERFHALGYRHVEIHGQKGYHGVATISRRPIEVVERRQLLRDCRQPPPLRPRPGRRPLDPAPQFLRPGRRRRARPGGQSEVPAQAWFRLRNERRARRFQDDLSGSILVGDLNIAPLEHDVWSHKQLLKVVSHTPVETEGFEAMRKGGGWVDLMRLNVPAEQKLYTWWSYRAADWAASDRGRRLDHIWSSENLVARPRRHRHLARRARLGPPLRPRAGHRPLRFRLAPLIPSPCGAWPRSGRQGSHARRNSRTSERPHRFASQIALPARGDELSPAARRPPRSAVSASADPR